MSRGGAFRVAIKDSAVETNSDVAQLRQTGEIVEYDSRSQAEAVARKVSESGEGPVRLQRAAPNDPADVDAYLVAAPEQHKHTPVKAHDGAWTFGVTANQYGALGELLLTTGGTPALEYFVQEDLGPYPSEAVADAVNLDLRTDPKEFDWETLCAPVDGERARWEPDCELRVWAGHSEILHRYFCEIKTGDSSFERHQQETMRAVAEVADVLKIRVRVEELPEQYTVRLYRVGEPDVNLDWDDVAESLSCTE